MSMYTLGLINGKVYRNGQFYEETIYIKDGRIAKILDAEEDYRPCKEIVDCSERLILPGFM